MAEYTQAVEYEHGQGQHEILPQDWSGHVRLAPPLLSLST
jgi:hypothetical protein